MNRLLAIARNSIPYIKELTPYAGSATACLLMQQLEYWFGLHPNGFFKFIEPFSEHEQYKLGTSWCEELAFNSEEFLTAFEKIGVFFSSRKAYSEAAEQGTAFTIKKTKGEEIKFYCSYYDEIKKLTFYFRNHSKVNAVLNAIIYGSTEENQTELSPSSYPLIKPTVEVLEADAETYESNILPQVSVKNSNYFSSRENSYDIEILKDIEQIIYNWRLRPWMQNAVSFKREMYEAVWKSNPDWYSLEGGRTPNLKKINDRLRGLEKLLRSLDESAIAAYEELSNYWTVAQVISHPEMEQALKHAAAIQEHQDLATYYAEILKQNKGIF